MGRMDVCYAIQQRNLRRIFYVDPFFPSGVEIVFACFISHSADVLQKSQVYIACRKSNNAAVLSLNA